MKTTIIDPTDPNSITSVLEKFKKIERKSEEETNKLITKNKNTKR